MTYLDNPSHTSSSTDEEITPVQTKRTIRRAEQATVTADQALPYLTNAQAEEFGKKMEAIRQSILEKRGAEDAAHIRKMVKRQRQLEVGGRALIYGGIFFPPALVAGAATLGAAKILDNMEVGHNIMHGQYDWMRDPKIHSSQWEWDTACPADQWKKTHNVEHHTWTNVVGMDRDVGYGILRMTEQEKWHPAHLLNPINNFLLAVFFQWGVALHDAEMDSISKTGKVSEYTKGKLKGMWKKARKQVLKDYVLFPALAGPAFLPVLGANIVANLIRNLWTYTIIFCGHFPEGVEQFSKESVAGETKGRWYLRQLLGSANIKGGKLFHIMSGHLTFQIEHHLFPDLPSYRYPEIAPQVQALCKEYGLPYNSGSIFRQFGTTLKRIFSLAVPTRAELGERFPVFA